ncbi:MAG: HAD family acid phosphatase [Sphingomonadaceae bacterium]
MRAAAAGSVLLTTVLLAGCVSVNATDSSGSMASAQQAATLAAQDAQTNMAADSDPLAQPASDSMRWLYGSGEAAGASIQAYRMLSDYAVAISKRRSVPQSVPMGLPGAPGGVGTVSCLNPDKSIKPLAVVFDVDETVILNRGYEFWQAYSGHGYDAKEWADYARTGAPFVEPVPGAVAGITRLREAGITVVFNTNRKSDTAAGTAAAIAAAGLGKAVHGDTLFLSGDDAMGSRKDGRRATIAAKYCVIALGGDNLGDFADVFNTSGLAPQARRKLASTGKFARLWGAGWFALPNPVYGDSIKGTVGEVFPPDARWKPGTNDEDK